MASTAELIRESREADLGDTSFSERMTQHRLDELRKEAKDYDPSSVPRESRCEAGRLIPDIPEVCPADLDSFGLLSSSTSVRASKKRWAPFSLGLCSACYARIEGSAHETDLRKKVDSGTLTELDGGQTDAHQQWAIAASTLFQRRESARLAQAKQWVSTQIGAESDRRAEMYISEQRSLGLSEDAEEELRFTMGVAPAKAPAAAKVSLSPTRSRGRRSRSRSPSRPCWSRDSSDQTPEKGTGKDKSKDKGFSSKGSGKDKGKSRGKDKSKGKKVISLVPAPRPSCAAYARPSSAQAAVPGGASAAERAANKRFSAEPDDPPAGSQERRDQAAAAKVLSSRTLIAELRDRGKLRSRLVLHED